MTFIQSYRNVLSAAIESLSEDTAERDSLEQNIANMKLVIIKLEKMLDETKKKIADGPKSQSYKELQTIVYRYLSTIEKARNAAKNPAKASEMMDYSAPEYGYFRLAQRGYKTLEVEGVQILGENVRIKFNENKLMGHPHYFPGYVAEIFIPMAYFMNSSAFANTLNMEIDADNKKYMEELNLHKSENHLKSLLRRAGLADPVLKIAVDGGKLVNSIAFLDQVATLDRVSLKEGYFPYELVMAMFTYADIRGIRLTKKSVKSTIEPLLSYNPKMVKEVIQIVRGC